MSKEQGKFFPTTVEEIKEQLKKAGNKIKPPKEKILDKTIKRIKAQQ